MNHDDIKAALLLALFVTFGFFLGLHLGRGMALGACP